MSFVLPLPRASFCTWGFAAALHASGLPSMHIQGQGGARTISAEGNNLLTKTVFIVLLFSLSVQCLLLTLHLIKYVWAMLV